MQRYKSNQTINNQMNTSLGQVLKADSFDE